MQLYKKAFKFAFDKHKDQKYGDMPYFWHLNCVESVLTSILFNVKNEVILSAALLHDVMEDCNVSKEEITQQFGEQVADLVLRLTDERAPTRKERKALTYPKIRESKDAVMIKLADRIANVHECLDNENKLKMYQKEHDLFKKALYVKGEFDFAWEELETLLNI